MAVTNYGVNNPLAVKLWAKKLFVEALKETWLYKFTGSTTSSIIQIKDETSKSAGDRITVGLRMQLTGDGVQGDGTLEGNEEALTTYTDNVFIDQLRHAVRSAGKMSEQRVPFSVRSEAKDGLRDWWADRIDTWGFNQLCGYTPVADTRFTGNQAVVAPDANHILRVGGAANDQSLTSANIFDLTQIDRAVERAKTLTPMIRPVMVNGEKKYVMFLHPYQVTDLRISTSSGQWLDIQKAAMMGGQISKNPIYTGALGEYNNVILHEAFRVTQGVSSASALTPVTTVRRAVLCGAQAGLIAYGRDSEGGEMSWVEELFDYGNQLGVSAGMIAGLKKTVFNSQDFATIVVSSYAAQH